MLIKKRRVVFRAETVDDYESVAIEPTFVPNCRTYRQYDRKLKSTGQVLQNAPLGIVPELSEKCAGSTILLYGDLKSCRQDLVHTRWRVLPVLTIKSVEG